MLLGSWKCHTARPACGEPRAITAPCLCLGLKNTSEGRWWVPTNFTLITICWAALSLTLPVGQHLYITCFKRAEASAGRSLTGGRQSFSRTIYMTLSALPQEPEGAGFQAHYCIIRHLWRRSWPSGRRWNKRSVALKQRHHKQGCNKWAQWLNPRCNSRVDYHAKPNRNKQSGKYVGCPGCI